MADQAKTLPVSGGDPISTREILRQIGAEWRIVFGFPAFFLVLTFLYLHLAQYRYSVDIQVTQVTSANAGGKESLGAIAAAAGLNIPGAANEGARVFELFVQGIYTRDTANHLAKDQRLMRALFPQDWDSDAGKWRDPHSWLHDVFYVAAKIVGAPAHPWQPPDGARLQDFIQNNVMISRDLKNPIVTIQIEYPDPVVAKSLLTRLHDVDDDNLREISLMRTTKYIDYLNNEIRNVAVGDYRDALISVMSAQEKRRIFASSPGVAYAAEIFQPATASPEPVEPNARVLLTLSLLIGSLLGAIAAFGWHNRNLAR